MTPAPTPGVKVTIGGKERTLRFTNWAMVRFEDECPPDAGTFRTTNTMIWAALLHEQPDLKLDDVVRMIDLAEFNDLAAAATRALRLAQGLPEDAEGNVAATG